MSDFRASFLSGKILVGLWMSLWNMQDYILMAIYRCGWIQKLTLSEAQINAVNNATKHGIDKGVKLIITVGK